MAWVNAKTKALALTRIDRRGRVSGTFVIDDGTGQAVSDWLAVAVAANGDAVVAWFVIDSDYGQSIVARHITRTGSLGILAQMSPTSEDISDGAALDISRSGTAVLAWARAARSNKQQKPAIQTRTLNADGTIEPVLTVDPLPSWTREAFGPLPPSVAALDNATSVVVWQDKDSRIKSRLVRSDGSMQSTQALSDRPGRSGIIGNVDLASNGRRVVVAWQLASAGTGTSSPTAAVYAATGDNGRFGIARRLVSGQRYPHNPDATINASGRAAVFYDLGDRGGVGVVAGP